MGILLRQMRGNLCSKKWKHYIEIWRHFVLSDGLALYFHQFENGFNQCGRNYHVLNNKTFVVLLTDFDL